MVVGDVFRTYLHLCAVSATYVITPLPAMVDGNFTKRVTLNGAVNATAVTVTEVSLAQRPGLYAVTFTPVAEGDYHVEVELTGDAVNPTFILDAYATTVDLDDVVADISAILVDTNEIQTKLPTNNIMGSGVKTDKDDEIDLINTNVGQPTDLLAAGTLHGKIGANAVFVGHDTIKEELIGLAAGTGGRKIQGL